MTEVAYTLNCTLSPSDDRDWIAENIQSNNDELSYSPDRDIPLYLDLRKDLRIVRNQGNQGSCVAQVGACMKEWQEVHDSHLNTYMSPQYIYNLRENTDTEGMYPRNMMKILFKQGCCLETVFPYGSSVVPDEDVIKEAKKYNIAHYAQCKTIEGLKKALYENGPCLIATPVYHYENDIWNPKKEADKIIGYHAMTVVGYTPTQFIIRNSWGTRWGDNGYTYFPISDWGKQNEVWTCIDNRLSHRVKKLSWFERLKQKIQYIITIIKEYVQPPSLR